jgi:hypothetical protein
VVVDADNGVAAIEQTQDKSRTDKTRCTGDKDLHGVQLKGN